MEANTVSEEVDDDPVNLFQPETRDAHTSEILEDVNAAKLVLDNWNNGGYEHEDGNITKNKEAFDHCRVIDSQQIRLGFQAI